MKNAYKLGLAAVAASIALVGCGGGSSSSTPATKVTGQFVDGYVAGLNYTCDPSGTSDVTNAMGEYTCNTGDTVTFSLGAYVLGSATASSGIVTPYDIQPDDETAAINVARLLQTLDTSDADDIITIPDSFTALDNSTVELNATYSDFELAIIEDLNDSEITDLIGSEAAQTTMDEDILNAQTDMLTALLAGKTLYSVGSDNTGDNWIDSIVFNSDATSLVWTSLTDTESGTHTVVVEGDKIILSGGDIVGTFELTFVEETADKLVFQGLDTNGTVVEEDFMFFDQATAEAYYDSLQPVPDATESALLREMLAGNTWKSADTTLTFNEAVTSVVVDGVSDTVSLDGMTLTHSEGMEVITIVNETTLSFSYNGVEAGEIFTLVTAQTTPDTTVPTTTEADLRLLLEGKTLYGQSDYSAWTFNSDATQISIVDADALDSVVPPELIVISLNGNTIIADGGATTVVAEISEEWINLTWTSGPDTGMTDKIYYDLAVLEAYYASVGLL